MQGLVRFGSKLVGGVLFSSVLYQGYIRLPQKFLFGSSPPALPEFAEDSLFLIFPGFGGVDANIDRIHSEVAKTDIETNLSRFVYTYDWVRWRGNTLRASFDSQRVGAQVGKELGRRICQNNRPPLTSIHIVGVSVGAFAADSCVKEFKKALHAHSNGQFTTTTRLTLLDPFTSRGIFGADYGAKHFGVDSDYCEHFVNTDDPVPFTNDPLPHVMNFDITASEARKSFTPLPNDNMHSWPAAYYGLYWKNKINPNSMKAEFPSKFDDKTQRGNIVKVL